MISSINDLPKDSGRRFLYGLFGRDHDVDSCEKDGCGPCAIITHYEQDFAKLREENARLREALKRISHAKADQLDHSVDITIIERCAKVAKSALNESEGK